MNYKNNSYKKKSIKRGKSGTWTEGGVHELYVQTGAVFVCEDNKPLYLSSYLKNSKKTLQLLIVSFPISKFSSQVLLYIVFWML